VTEEGLEAWRPEASLWLRDGEAGRRGGSEGLERRLGDGRWGVTGCAWRPEGSFWQRDGEQGDGVGLATQATRFWI